MTYLLRITTLLLLLNVFACNGEKASSTKDDDAVQTAYEPLPQSERQKMFQMVDYIDYMIYNLPISMNQAEKDAITTTLVNIKDEAPPATPVCPSIGRVFFMHDGENTWQADLHIGKGCAYYVFLKDGKPAYANIMTPQGLSFYQQVFKNFQ